MDGIFDSIAAAYETGDYGGWGWRHLYGPRRTLRAEVAIIGLNPGGTRTAREPEAWPEADPHAFVHEPWGHHAPGAAPLQKQYAHLCDALGVEVEETLGFNVVPFRSPNFDALPNRRAATAFGRETTLATLAQSSATRIVINSWQAARALGIENSEKASAGWGKQLLGRGQFGDRRAYVLPHLSRFKLFSRPDSKARVERFLAA